MKDLNKRYLELINSSLNKVESVNEEPYRLIFLTLIDESIKSNFVKLEFDANTLLNKIEKYQEKNKKFKTIKIEKKKIHNCLNWLSKNRILLSNKIGEICFSEETEEKIKEISNIKISEKRRNGITLFSELKGPNKKIKSYRGYVEEKKGIKLREEKFYYDIHFLNAERRDSEIYQELFNCKP